jgi:hypothetical protein
VSYFATFPQAETPYFSQSILPMVVGSAAK